MENTIMKIVFGRKLTEEEFDKIAEWLDENIPVDGAPWTMWFDENYCRKCDIIKTKYDFGSGEREVECSYCEINGECRFIPDKSVADSNLEVIKLWLAQEAM